MIKSFKNKETEAAYDGIKVKAFGPDVLKAARRKLAMVAAAVILDDLRSPPANRLEALSGSRTGQHSIRVNDQFRICFVWNEGHAYDVELVDYHR